MRRTKRPPSCRATPVTSTTLPKISAYLPSQPCRAPVSAPPGSRRHVSGSMLRCDDRAMQEVTTATDVRTDRGRRDVALRSHTTPRNRPHKAHGTTVAPHRTVEGPQSALVAAVAYFLLRRCTRVRFSSLRCFFLAIRLRRFLITEPTTTLAHFSSLGAGRLGPHDLRRPSLPGPALSL